MTALSIADPVDDAQGNGSYQLPTLPAINADALDLRQFSVDGSPLQFVVTYGALQNPWNLKSGFSAGVTDIFVGTSETGVTSLPDLGLNVPGGWTYHVRVTGANATLTHAVLQDDQVQMLALPAPLVSLEGTSLRIQTQIPAGKYAYWVTSSVYSPLTPHGIVQPSKSLSAIALRTSSLQDPAPVDMLAENNTAYVTRVLEPVGFSTDSKPMILSGVGIAALLLSLIAWIIRLLRG